MAWRGCAWEMVAGKEHARILAGDGCNGCLVSLPHFSLHAQFISGPKLEAVSVIQSVTCSLRGWETQIQNGAWIGITEPGLQQRHARDAARVMAVARGGGRCHPPESAVSIAIARSPLGTLL
jgi:hypothetical protein